MECTYEDATKGEKVSVYLKWCEQRKRTRKGLCVRAYICVKSMCPNPLCVVIFLTRIGKFLRGKIKKKKRSSI